MPEITDTAVIGAIAAALPAAYGSDSASAAELSGLIGVNPGRLKPDGADAWFGVPYSSTVQVNSDSLASVAADNLYLFPLYLPFPIILSAVRLSAFITGGGTVKVGLVAADTNLQPSGDLVHPEVAFTVPNEDNTEIDVSITPVTVPAGRYLITLQSNAAASLQVATTHYPVQGWPDGEFVSGNVLTYGFVSRAYAPLVAPIENWDTGGYADLGGTIVPVLYEWTPLGGADQFTIPEGTPAQLATSIFEDSGTPAKVTAAYVGSPSDAEGLAAAIGSPITETFTVPSTWILAHSADGALRELKAGVAGKTYMVLGAVAKLVFNSAAYTGATGDTDINVCVGVDGTDTPAVVRGTIPINFWDAVSNATAYFVSSGYETSQHKNCEGAAIKVLLNGAGLADGDSDVEITVTYVAV